MKIENATVFQNNKMTTMKIGKKNKIVIVGIRIMTITLDFNCCYSQS